MNFLRKHWYDLGGILAIIIISVLYFYHTTLTNYQLLMWLSLVSLFFHQLEEYRIVGTFPGMINSLFKSKMPDRYPLNTNSSFYVNLVIGWTIYALAAILSEKAIWLGIATIIVSIGNIIAHTIFFNIKGKTLYYAGMATSWLLFVPCAYFFISIILTNHLATTTDYIIGIVLGIIFNFVGVLKLIDWMADENTTYAFEKRNLLPKDRNKKK